MLGLGIAELIVLALCPLLALCVVGGTLLVLWLVREKEPRRDDSD